MLNPKDYLRPVHYLASPREAATVLPSASPATAPSHSLTTVMIRSLGRPTIHGALASVARQTHRDVEVVVVDATGGKHPPLPAHCGAFPLRIVANGRPLNRPQAANAGLDHARGEWMIFLDDDDFFDADHIARLHRCATENRVPVAYAGTRLLDENDCLIRVLNERYSRLALLTANHIQMGAAIFHRSLLDKGCRFDESMLLYQDWDFWLQLSMHTHFAHSVLPTNNWRMYTGQSGAGGGPNANRELQAKFDAHLKAKWKHELDRLVSFVRHAVRFSNEEIMHGRPEHAVKVLHRALAIAPNDPSLINLLGLANFNAGDVASAWYALCEAQALLPNNPAIQRNLAQVARLRQ
jgi:glycosyltransferase involved in cell wall biosynthesis